MLYFMEPLLKRLAEVNVMKLEQIFKEFILVVQENPKYKIGFVDNFGKVISSSDEKENGQIIDFNRQSSNDHFYKIAVKGTNYGYLWVNGRDDSLGIVANLLSESLKTRIIFEMNQESTRQSLSLEDQLIKALITKDGFDIDEVLGLIKNLHIDSSLPRVAINIIKNTPFNTQEVTDLKYKINEDETIYSLMKENEILMFKLIPGNLMERRVREYLDRFIAELQEWGLTDCYYIVGSVQEKIRLYEASFSHCNWMKKNCVFADQKVFHFWDHILNYLAANLSHQQANNLFDYSSSEASKIDVRELVTIARHLYENDYNLTQTAESLFLHKNTLIYKIKRFEELFQLDIRGSFQGKIQFYLLANYLNENSKRGQAGENL